MLGILYAGIQGLILAQDGGHDAPATGGEHAAEETHNPLLPETDELVWGSIAFLIVFLAFRLLAWPRMKTMLQERSDRIQGEMQRAEQTRAEADQVLEQYRQQLANAREEANRIIEEGRQTADALRRDLQEKAERDAQGIVNRAQEEIRAERERAFNDLKSQVAELSVELATRVVGESLDRERQLRLVEQYIEELSATGAAAGGGTGDGGASDGGGQPGAGV